MSIITLISDWYKNDYYSAVVKANILSKKPDAQIVEINHQIESFDINQAAFLLSSSLLHFPKGTIHIVAVNAHQKEIDRFLIGVFSGQYIICSDNGLLGLLQQEMEAVYVVNQVLSTFPEADQFAPVAVLLSEGKQIEEIGELEGKWGAEGKSTPAVEGNKITIQIRYIDSYGNAHLNLTKEMFESEKNGRAFSIYLKSMKHKIESISTNYSQLSSNELFALFNSDNYMEIGVYRGNISEQYNLKELEDLLIVFRNELF